MRHFFKEFCQPQRGPGGAAPGGPLPGAGRSPARAAPRRGKGNAPSRGRCCLILRPPLGRASRKFRWRSAVRSCEP